MRDALKLGCRIGRLAVAAPSDVDFSGLDDGRYGDADDEDPET